METPNSVKVSPASSPEDEQKNVSSLFDRIKQLQADLRSSQSENSRLRVMLQARFDTSGVDVPRQRRNYEFFNRALVALTGEPRQVVHELGVTPTRRTSEKRTAEKRRSSASSNDLLQDQASAWNCVCFPLACRDPDDDDDDEWEDTTSCY